MAVGSVHGRQVILLLSIICILAHCAPSPSRRIGQVMKVCKGKSCKHSDAIAKPVSTTTAKPVTPTTTIIQGEEPVESTTPGEEPVESTTPGELPVQTTTPGEEPVEHPTARPPPPPQTETKAAVKVTLGKKFNKAYSNTSSPEFKALKKEMSGVMDEACKNIKGYLRSEVVGAKNGSIELDIRVIMNTTEISQSPAGTGNTSKPGLDLQKTLTSPEVVNAIAKGSNSTVAIEVKVICDHGNDTYHVGDDWEYGGYSYTCGKDGTFPPKDIDECLEETDDCDQNANCSNTKGYYTCSCNKGFTGNGRTCRDSTPGGGGGGGGAGPSDFNYPGCGVKGPRTSPKPKSSRRSQKKQDLRTRIIGGKDAQPGEWPWQVYIRTITKRFRDGRYLFVDCGGTILTDTIVLTAAHCVCNETTKISWPDTDIFVYGGVHDTREALKWNPAPHIQKRGIQNKVVHTDYLSNNLTKDIAILRVKTKFQLNNRVNTACLPPKDNLYAGVMATATGWGRTVWYDTNSKANILKEMGTYLILANEHCPDNRAPIGDYAPSPDYEVCARDAQRGTCQGDSGGPLVVTGANNKWQVVGVVSYGWNGANCVGDGHLMRVTYFLDWIKDNAKCLNTCTTRCVNAQCVH